MASMRDIKRRRESIENTEQITKAMKLVATVKLQKARSRAENGLPYMHYLYDTMLDVLSRVKTSLSPYLRVPDHELGKRGVILITSNRGLAGGYNTNVIRTVVNAPELPKDDTVIYTIGRKGRDFLRFRDYDLADDYSDVINAPLYRDAMEITSKLLQEYSEGKLESIYLAFTEFKNTITHIPHLLRLLPIDREYLESREMPVRETPMNFEPDDEEVLNEIVPQYVAGLIHGALLSSVASENGARMAAMDAATDNAHELADQLSLSYNRARQSAITQELTEIIAGSQALN